MRYKELSDKRLLICRDCSTPSTGFMIPADEKVVHDAWHESGLAVAPIEHTS